MKAVSCSQIAEERQASVISHEDNLEMIPGSLPQEYLTAFRFSDSVLFLGNNDNWVDKNDLFWKECNLLLAVPESQETRRCLES